MLPESHDWYLLLHVGYLAHGVPCQLCREFDEGKDEWSQAQRHLPTQCQYIINCTLVEESSAYHVPRADSTPWDYFRLCIGLHCSRRISIHGSHRKVSNIFILERRECLRRCHIRKRVECQILMFRASEPCEAELCRWTVRAKICWISWRMPSWLNHV